ncbi:MAG TPA: hypothetical protein VEB65_02320 [Solirubrobacterales bacterium]|nr:hypothetical protein [Solirubrobacterales bacterium]
MVAATAALALWAPVASAATPGDNLAEALPLSGPLPIEVSGTNVGATKESDELVGSFAAGHSVWFAWTASVSGWVTVGTCGSPLATVVGILSGTEFGSLTPVTAFDGPSPGPRCPDRPSEYTFRATSGSEYRIAVDGNTFSPSAPGIGTEGTFPLRIEATPPPANDDLAAAAPVAGIVSEEPKGGRIYLGSAPGYNWGATKQVGEPAHGGDPGGASVWYAWTAPESGQARINAMGPGAGASIIGVYTGSALGSLVPVASNPWSGFAIPAVSAGTTYLIAVDGRRDPMTGEVPGFGFHLQIGMPLAPGPGQPQQASQPPATTPLPPAVPRTILLKRSVDPDKRTATFVFKSTAPGSRYRCKLDRRRYRSCRSPKTYRHLSGGHHVFRAVAVSAAGIADPTPLVARLSLPKR